MESGLGDTNFRCRLLLENKLAELAKANRFEASQTAPVEATNSRITCAMVEWKSLRRGNIFETLMRPLDVAAVKRCGCHTKGGKRFDQDSDFDYVFASSGVWWVWS